jgi:hypothetical protein
MTAHLIPSALILIFTWLDVASTLYGYRKYRLQETSFIWRELLPHPALFYTLQTVFWGLMIAILFAGEATLEWFVALCVARLGTVAWNVMQIVKARRKA